MTGPRARADSLEEPSLSSLSSPHPPPSALEETGPAFALRHAPNQNSTHRRSPRTAGISTPRGKSQTFRVGHHFPRSVSAGGAKWSETLSSRLHFFHFLHPAPSGEQSEKGEGRSAES
jgi:hypothetical protein